jgi:CDP-2,3-bis-(O-geranylgeranyl)-sn-glycerol synthase
MYEELALIGLALWLGLPAWVANATPVIFGGGRPIDAGLLFRDGNRILGDGKTIRGFISGIIFGIFTGVAQSIAAPHVRLHMVQYLTVSQDMEVILFSGVSIALILSIGALLGDLVGSFLKRRVNLRSGAPSPMLDQLGFVLMALILAAPFLQLNPVYPAILILVTLVIHWVSNAGSYLLGLKKNPW